MDRMQGRRPYPSRARIAAAWGALCCLGLVGCVERRYTIRTDPPGALVFVNGQEMGPSPISSDFTYYGDREIVIVADGYETERIIQKINAPIYDNALTDFFTENLLPFTVRDEREFIYRLRPRSLTPPAELEQRADMLRMEGQQPPKPRRRGLFGFLGF
ncbi:MAG TPA: PEGA domain-containing protein [Isosphaeraceae bacterium]|nr:PEGA domain-containing protein [Isosphaeraceae bacterium]